MQQRYLYSLIGVLAMLLIGLHATSSYAQRVVQVPQGVGTLNEAIDSDTTSTGERVDPNTIYEVENGGLYLLNGSIEHRGFHLHIRTPDIEGEKARLVPAVVEGGESSRAFRARGDLTIEGLFVTNEDELGGVNTRIIRISADSVTITLRNCHLDKDGQSAFRFDNNGISVFMYNTIVSNIAGDYDNGRGFDDRGNNIEELVVENCTFYNISSRVLRDGGGFIKNFVFNHNTVVNTGRRVVDIGEAVNVEFTNNLMVQHSILGQDTSSTFTVVNVDSLTSESLAGLTQTVLISNNNFYRDPAYDAVYPDSAEAVPLFNETAQAFIDEAGTGNTVYMEAVEFANGPAVQPEQVQDFWDSGQNNTIGIPFDTSGEPFDFEYPQTAAAFTRGTDGLPLGDLNWFGLATSVEDLPSSPGPETFRLLSNYPNPFNPETNIVYNLPNRATVSLTIFNTLGQKITTLIDAQQLNAGEHVTRWDGRDDSGRVAPSGVYFYRLEAGDFSQTSKMLLLR